MAVGKEQLKKVFKVPEPKLKTSITKIEQNKLITRGYSQEELINNISFSEMVYLLLKGELPSSKEAKILNHILVSFCDHGLTPPSTQSARLISSSGSPLNVCLSGGLLSFGKNHAGAIEEAMKLFQTSIANFKKEIKGKNYNNNELDEIIEKIAIEIFESNLNKNTKIPGFGHRYHVKDPRASKIIEIAIKEKYLGYHTKLALAIDELLCQNKGININIDGVNAGLLSDMGFHSRLGVGIFMIGRIPGLVAHIHEESFEEKEFRKFLDLEDIQYNGIGNKSLDEK